MQESFESPAILASIKNQLAIGGIDLIITKIINKVKNALKVFVLIFLFNKSKYLFPENSILIKCSPIIPKTKGNKKLAKFGKNEVILTLKKEFRDTFY